VIEQIRITGKEIPQPFGERQHPLTYRDLWKDLINQVDCRLLHPPGIAAGTDILQAVMICAFLKTLTPALSRRERGKKPQSVPVLSIDSASFTREGDEKIVSTAGTSCSGKAMRQDTTLEIFAEILLDVSSNRGTFLICLTTTGQPGFQMTLNDLISRAALRLPTPINLMLFGTAGLQVSAAIMLFGNDRFHSLRDRLSAAFL